MSGTSKLTLAIMVRLPVDIAKVVKFNAAKKEIGVSEYLRIMITKQVDRKR
jgi:hypothetical protein